MSGILNTLRQTPTKTENIRTASFSWSTNTQGEETEVATYQTEVPLSFDPSRPFDLSLTAYETFTTDGTGGNTETFNLAHDLIDSEVVKDSLVLYEGDSRVQPDSVDYSGDSFDYTDDGTGNTLTAFYTSGEQALVEVEKVAPNNVAETVWSGDIGMIHRRNHGKDPLYIEADATELSPVIPTDYEVRIKVNAPYTVGYSVDATDSGTETVATNALADVPVQAAPAPIDGLDREVRLKMAEV